MIIFFNRTFTQHCFLYIEDLKIWIVKHVCHNPSLGLVTKANICKGAGQV